MATPTTTQRGYGWQHQLARRRWARLVAIGDANCSRCGRGITPDMKWDLDHSDDRGNTSAWCGASHLQPPSRRSERCGRDEREAPSSNLAPLVNPEELVSRGQNGRR
jgi:hypothetical protein